MRDQQSKLTREEQREYACLLRIYLDKFEEPSESAYFGSIPSQDIYYHLTSLRVWAYKRPMR